MDSKERLVVLLRYLKDNTDEETEVSAADIRRMFGDIGESISAPTLRDDIASLQRAKEDMIRRDTPEHYRADIKKYCLLALRRHFTHVDGIMPCDDCPWEGQTAQYEPCDLIFLDELSDILRTYTDDESRRLADQLEICKKYDYDICSTCKNFNPCYTDEDLTPMLNEVFLHLHRHGVC